MYNNIQYRNMVKKEAWSENFFTDSRHSRKREYLGKMGSMCEKKSKLSDIEGAIFSIMDWHGVCSSKWHDTAVALMK